MGQGFGFEPGRLLRRNADSVASEHQIRSRTLAGSDQAAIEGRGGQRFARIRNWRALHERLTGESVKSAPPHADRRLKRISPLWDNLCHNENRDSSRVGNGDIMRGLGRIGLIIFSGIVLSVLLMISSAAGQETNQVAAAANSAATLTVTLQDALARAQTNAPQYRAALTEYGVARENRVQSRAALLPNVNYNAQFLYTQGNDTSTGRYIASNGVHEYVSEGNAHQALSLLNVAEYRRARAEEALAKARAEIATRGLVVTVVQAYYGSVVAQRKYSIAQRAAGEAQHFFEVTGKLERGGEVAHADTIKAQLQLQQQQRALQDAELEMERSRLQLAVLIFPNFNENFSTVDDLENIGTLPSFQEVEAQAGNNNPQLQAALASLKAANQEVAVAWNSFLPSLGFDYFYGIDANHFAVNGVDPATGSN